MGKIYMNRKRPGLRIVLKSRSQGEDEFGNKKMIPGVYIDFIDGRVKIKSDDKHYREKVAKLKKFMADNQGEVTVVDEKEIEREHRIRKRVEKEIEKEMRQEKLEEEKAKKLKGGKVDDHGKDITKGPKKKFDAYGKEITEPTDVEIDAAEPGDKKYDDMNKKELLKIAKDMGLRISKKKSNPQIIKIITTMEEADKQAEANAQKSEEAMAGGGSDEPNLEDESESGQGPKQENKKKDKK